MKNGIYIIFVLLFQTTLAQVTFVVDKLPGNTPEAASIYISGNFEGWTGGNESYKLTKKDNAYYITIPKDRNTIQFKFTQGSWDTVERDENGSQIDNRAYTFERGNDTVNVEILSWDANAGPKSTKAKNVFVLSEEFEVPQLNRKRRIWMYLPPNYKTSSENFPVIYMHDGQNLFDKTTSYSEEWEVDEILNKLYKDNNMSFIVVGIDNGGKNRMNEYSPWQNQQYGGGEGDAYLDFIVKTLKPHIDANYKTLTNKENTAIIGSSMGGLISHYAALKYPKVFGKIGVFSPSFWFSPKASEYVKSNGNIENTKLYFLVGQKEGGTMVSDMETVVDMMTSNEKNKNNIFSKADPNGEHNEAFWRNNFEEAILWLFPEKVKKREYELARYREEDYFTVKVSDGMYLIQFYSKDIVETTFLPKGEEFDKTSHAVTLKPEKVDVLYSYGKSENIYFKAKEGIEVKVQKYPFKISYSYKGKSIISERNGYQKNDEFETIRFNLNEDEVLYGAGARALGMNRRGHRLQLYNKAHYGYETHSELMNYTMPIVLSSNQYMLHFDNAPIGYLDLDSQQDNTLTYETISGRKTYQVIVGDSWLDIIDNYTTLTGKQPMPPRWAFGNFSSRFGYHSQYETEATIDKFIEDEIPVDAIILDLYWFGKEVMGTMGNLEVHRDSFPDFEGMVNRLKNKGVKTITITEPFILPTSKKWQETVEKNILAKDSVGKPARFDIFFGNTGIIDIYKPEAEQWFWNIYKDLANKGVAGFWGDLGEPEVHPSWVQHHTGSADEVHNIYGHDWARLVYEGYQRDFPNQRPFILMRAGYSGSQRYGFMPWSGDVNRTWGGLRSQPEIALQMGMQGLAYMHSDLGGFAGANLDDELYTRWLQYGVFQPIYRPHAQEEVPSEPVFRSKKAKALAKQSIELRYKLLPYNYTLAFENNQKGTPLMRPIFFEESTNKTQQVSASTYFWGNDFLVTPIINSGVKEKEVYFPKNNIWFDFYTDEKIEGGQTKTVSVKENSIPTYVRSGAFIPMTKVMQSTDDFEADNLEVHYYFDESVKESEYKMYNDDGLTKNAFEKDMYELLEFEAELEKHTLEIELEAEIGKNYSALNKEIKLVIHNVQNQPKQVKVNKKQVNINWQEQNRTLTIPVIWNTAKKTEIKIKLNNQ